MGGTLGVTAEGYEKQFGINHVGYALFLQLLLPILLKTSKTTSTPPRVVFSSSRDHKVHLPNSSIAFNMLKSAQLHILCVKKYTQSKFANFVYARPFAKRYPSLI
jgi:retinol dehydrogenase-12